MCSIRGLGYETGFSPLHKEFAHSFPYLRRSGDGCGWDQLRGLPGETLGVVGESGCGKSVTALSILRLLASPPAEIQGTILFGGVNLLDLNLDEIRRIRGNAISMIFQEPMTSLNPVLTIGEQISEAIRLHQGLTRQEAWSKAVEMLRMVQIPSPEMRVQGISSSIERWNAAEGDDRHGFILPSTFALGR